MDEDHCAAGIVALRIAVFKVLIKANAFSLPGDKGFKTGRPSLTDICGATALTAAVAPFFLFQ